MDAIIELLRKMSTLDCFYVVKDLNGTVIYSFIDIDQMKSSKDKDCNPVNQRNYNVTSTTYKNVIVETWTDVTELVSLKEQLSKSENKIAELERDYLTGLSTRKTITKRFLELIRSAIDNGNNLVVVMCDIDKFKDINDKYGHNNGDNVLSTFGQILNCNALASGFIASRYAGDEFLIIYPNQEIKEVLKSLNVIKEQFGEFLFTTIDNKNTFRATASFGVCEFLPSSILSDDYSTMIASVTDQADKAMYYSKTQGRNNISYYNSENQSFEIYNASYDKSI